MARLPRRVPLLTASPSWPFLSFDDASSPLAPTEVVFSRQTGYDYFYDSGSFGVNPPSVFCWFFFFPLQFLAKERVRKPKTPEETQTPPQTNTPPPNFFFFVPPPTRWLVEASLVFLQY